MYPLVIVRHRVEDGVEQNQSLQVAVHAPHPNWVGAVSAALAAAGYHPVGADPEAPVTVVGGDATDLREAVAAAPDTTLVLAVGPDDPEVMVELLEAGAFGYVLEEAGFERICEAVAQLLDGHAVVPPAMLGTLLRRIVVRRRVERGDAERLAALTGREREVLELVAQGCDNDAIADRLYISPATARTHLQRVFKKIDVHSRAEAVAFAARCGIPTRGGTDA